MQPFLKEGVFENTCTYLPTSKSSKDSTNPHVAGELGPFRRASASERTEYINLSHTRNYSTAYKYSLLKEERET